MPTGVIATYFATRSFGFIRSDGGEPDTFFHASVVQNIIEGEIERGLTVEFDTGVDKSGRHRATRVVVMDPE